MSHDCAITHRLLANQRTMFRLADAGFGFSQKAIHLLTGMSPSVIGQYARGETAMGGPAICKLAGIKEFPAELLSLLFAGTNRFVGDEPITEGSKADYDDIALGALALAGEVQKARSESSPGGTAIVHSEEELIRRRASSVVGKVGRAA